MMELLIERIRALAPSFAGRVAGAADEAGILAQQVAVLPAAFLYPVGDGVEEPRGDYHLIQPIQQQWTIIAVLDATADLLGQAAVSAAFGILREEIWRALLGWQPEQRCEPIRYAGARVLKRDAARLWVGFSFDVPRTLSEGAGELHPADPDDPVNGADLVPFERFAPRYLVPTTEVPVSDLVEPPQ